MKDLEQFKTAIFDSYNEFKGLSLTLGGAVFGIDVVKDLKIQLPLSTFNRHGLISGATGTGKTKTLQKLVEGLSENGVPSLVMDIKGDFSGISQLGEINEKIKQRHDAIGIEWKPQSYPVEFLTISNEAGVRLKATIAEFGPVLFSKILEVNDIQEGVISLVFKYCDDKNIPLVDLQDFKSTLLFLSNEGKAEISREYGSISSASVGSIMRKIIQIEEQGADTFFGEVSFDVNDLISFDEKGFGKINLIRLIDMQNKPSLFSVFMLSILAEIYATFPEEGDLDKPKLVLFIDEAHLIFNNASKALLEQIETTIKLIRSKGIGVFFITQNPMDIPASVLGQLGMKVQHALRAFTAQDRFIIKKTAENYPLTDFYDIDQTITELGIGEAFVTALNEKGIPTALVKTMICSPQSRMDTISIEELNSIVEKSNLIKKYNTVINRDSAHEILQAKMDRIPLDGNTFYPPIASKNPAPYQNDQLETNSSPSKNEKNTLEKISKNTMVRQVGNTIIRELTRGLLGALGLKKRR